MDIKNTILDNLFNFAGLFVVGALTVIGLFTREKQKTHAQSDLEEDRLIALLTAQREELGKMLNERDSIINNLKTQTSFLDSQSSKMRGEINTLTVDVEKLTRILQGRDPRAQEFQEKGFVAMERIANLETVVTQNTARFADLQKEMVNIGKHLERLYEVMKQCIDTK